jgi:hypothetical protein
MKTFKTTYWYLEGNDGKIKIPMIHATYINGIRNSLTTAFKINQTIPWIKTYKNNSFHGPTIEFNYKEQ